MKSSTLRISAFSGLLFTLQPKVLCLSILTGPQNGSRQTTGIFFALSLTFGIFDLSLLLEFSCLPISFPAASCQGFEWSPFICSPPEGWLCPVSPCKVLPTLQAKSPVCPQPRHHRHVGNPNLTCRSSLYAGSRPAI